MEMKKTNPGLGMSATSIKMPNAAGESMTALIDIGRPPASIPVSDMNGSAPTPVTAMGGMPGFVPAPVKIKNLGNR